MAEAAQPNEQHGMDLADSATDEFDHELALSLLSVEQDALYEVEAAMRRIVDGSYGVCEGSGGRISATRLRAVPWTRFQKAVAARLEREGVTPRRRLGPLRSLRDEPAAAFAEIEEAAGESRPKAAPARLGGE
ncbi:MAG: TraR/DksA C4-type zinc finger protein [Terrimicrobiaceae bacterium]|nr:TraR/DksA C4-type zinc finger protein [Terrimicrobiaceae bacterium]